MIIDKAISQYILFSEETVLVALNKITENKSRMVVLINESGIVEGVLTDGDFRRWITNQKEIDLNRPAKEAANRSFISARHDEQIEKIETLFGAGIDIIPLVDEYGRLVALARKAAERITIGSHEISHDSPCFIIAEIGINHNGSLDIAKRMIEEAVQAGADCVKFQMRHMESLYRNENEDTWISEDLGSQYARDILSRFQLDNEEMFAAFDYCRELNVLPLCTPWDSESVVALDSYGMHAFKVGSADMTNFILLERLAQTKKPIIMSTGMSHEGEIIDSVAFLKKFGVPYVLLHCNSTYPAPFKDLNLNYMSRLAEIGNCPVGYSGHERGIHIPLAAVSLGAKVIEKHFTLDRNMEGRDHKVSLLPDEFRRMVDAIRELEQALGSGSSREMSQGEMMNRENLAKSLVVNRDIKAGTMITRDIVEIKSPGNGLQPNRLSELLNIRAKRDMKAGDFFFPTDLRDDTVEARPYSFRLPWGLPVRFHDYKNLLGRSNPDFLEFHLSYKDLDLNYLSFFSEKMDLDLTVHSPDMFPGDHLLNLASEDAQYRKRSIEELQRVIDLTRNIQPYFTRATCPLIIVSVGGFTHDQPMDADARWRAYEQVAESLEQLDADGVELLPQTLPPFPWYFGGQLYCNIFVDAEDTVEFCKRFERRVCFDVSHSKLTCNHRSASFKDFSEKILPHSAHLHIVDARGVDGEGVQIGEGEIDFAVLAEQIDKHAPKASFIPEIWQGHKNDGEGFWIALDRLEKWL